MKTQTQKQTRTKKFIKAIVMVSLATTLFTSCGQKNTSGSSSSSNSNNLGTYNYPGTAGAAGAQGMSLPSNWLDIVAQENPCLQGGQRQSVIIPVTQTNINAGSFYVGVTAEGDIAIASNQGQGAVIEALICPRVDATGQGSLDPHVVLNTSSICPVGEISKANISLQSQYGYPYTLSFYPIAISGSNQTSSMCSSGQIYY